jgi:hypothetical protein
MSRLERQAMLAMAVALSLATAIALAACSPARANGDGGIQARATAWHQERAHKLEILRDAERRIRELGGEARVTPEIAVLLDRESYAEGIEIINSPVTSLAGVVAKIGVLKALDLDDMRTQDATEAVGAVLADVAVIGECETIKPED